MSDYDLSDLDIGTPVPEVKPHDIFGNSSLADAFRRAFKDMNMSNVVSFAGHLSKTYHQT
jgi:hypothetical protein